jgi:hypothetical protein
MCVSPYSIIRHCRQSRASSGAFMDEGAEVGFIECSCMICAPRGQITMTVLFVIHKENIAYFPWNG